jgi:hypothetical protein
MEGFTNHLVALTISLAVADGNCTPTLNKKSIHEVHEQQEKTLPFVSWLLFGLPESGLCSALTAVGPVAQQAVPPQP